MSTKPAAGQQAYAHVYRDTEQFIEDRFRVDIRYDLPVECCVTQRGYRPDWLSEMLARRIPLLRNKKLEFSADTRALPPGCDLYWKVRNRGVEAERRDMIRGQIVPDGGRGRIEERSDFHGDHYVECYAVLNGVVVARGSILVPIDSRAAEAA